MLSEVFSIAFSVTWPNIFRYMYCFFLYFHILHFTWPKRWNFNVTHYMHAYHLCFGYTEGLHSSAFIHTCTCYDQLLQQISCNAQTGQHDLCITCQSNVTKYWCYFWCNVTSTGVVISGKFQHALYFLSVTVSFDPTTYTVAEGDGVANLMLVRSGGLTRTVVVTVTTAAGTAMGMTHYMYIVVAGL